MMSQKSGIFGDRLLQIVHKGLKAFLIRKAYEGDKLKDKSYKIYLQKSNNENFINT